MATRDESQILAELNKLRKSDLIDLILYRRLPVSVADNEVLNMVVKSMSDCSLNGVGDNFVVAESRATVDCVGCRSFQREIGVYVRLSDQLEQRTRDQAHLIELLRLHNSENPRKNNFGRCEGGRPAGNNLLSRGNVKDTTVKKPSDTECDKKQSSDNVRNKVNVTISASSVTPSAVDSKKSVNSDINTGSSTHLFAAKEVSTGILLAETRAVMDKYVNLTKPDVSTIKNDSSEDWKSVKSRKHRRSVLVGDNKESSVVKGVPRFVHLHVYRVSPETTAEDLTGMLKVNFPEVVCETLVPRHPGVYASFKVSVFGHNFKTAMNASLWPQGACISRFFFPRKDKDRGLIVG